MRITREIYNEARKESHRGAHPRCYVVWRGRQGREDLDQRYHSSCCLWRQITPVSLADGTGLGFVGGGFPAAFFRGQVLPRKNPV